MAQQTTLTPLALSGRLYGSFSGKSAAALPKGDGPFTRLSVEGLPGRRYGVFTGKGEVIVEPPVEPIRGGGGPIKRRGDRELEKEFEELLLREKLLEEDEEIIMILATMYINGYL